MAKFISNVLKLGSASIMGQILGLIVTPFLSRLYSPADFGTFSLFFAIVNLLGVVSCLSYQSAINLPKKDEDAADVTLLCFLLIAITAILTAVFFNIFSSDIERILNAPGLSRYLFLLPFAIISNCSAFVLGFWLSRRQQFGTMAIANLSSSVTGKATSIGVGIISPSPFGLIFGTIINDATLSVIYLRTVLEDFHLFRKASFQNIKQLAIRYKQFPQYNLGASLAINGSMQLTPFLLVFFFSPSVVGFYAMAYMVLFLPSKLMGNSLSSVFYQKACAEKNLTGCISNVVKTVHTRLVSIGTFTCLIIIIIGPELFAFALGDKWLSAGLYAQILAPWFFVVFISTPMISIFNVMEMQGANLGFNVLLLITRVVVLVSAGLYGDPVLALILLSVTGVVFWTWMNMYLLKIAGVSVRDALKEIGHYLVFGIAICFPLIIAKLLSVPSIFLIIIAAMTTALYYGMIITRDPQLRKGLLDSLKNVSGKKV